ncbi:molybdenum cofactor synthesis domain-containing protein [Halarchaeum rubridurum]|uniref:Molybdenum cofactor synthesis domain-containing protein n=1 Tax=Halarchaeum rubridurum TaxID=489911 RepID=A0A830FNN2_9EURY|nr:molybdopterin biosynthesis protein [Halarchaeum rubridurum]MBP1953866.1 molybdenum cofactor synthesis domain-containing protein [Halarchaeum rubridurum]GGM55443.1 molybdopterin biosynthesis protein [Halarchaeum rubridurum]
MTDRKEFRDLASPAEAHEVVASLDIAPDPETVPLAECRGRVLAERVDAGIDVPGFDRASMDGYAVRARDTFGADETDPVVLPRVGTVHAGTEPDVDVGAGECVEISTGAVLPGGADAVVPVERTHEADESDGVAFETAVAPGDSVMAAGADVAAGERALGPDTELTPREIGLLSALGVDEVPVRGRPTVGVVSTGDELVRPGEALDHGAGEIHDVNSYTVAAAVEEAGGEAVLYPHAGDDYDELERQLRSAAAECDLVLSSGSTSASAVDVVYRVIEERGDLLLHGVSIKPGKPMLVGRLGGAAYVGLPGYPVSALTIFRTFVAPAIRDAAGRPDPERASVTGRLASAERHGQGRTRLVPVGLVADGAGETLVYPVDKGSGATTSLVEADGVVEMDADTDYLAAGETVTVELFSPAVRPPAVLCVGEDDPLFARALDGVRDPRYLAAGTRTGFRRLRDGLPDVVVASGPDDPGEATAELAAWTREWGLLVPAGNPDDVAGLADLAGSEGRFVNRTTASGLRATFDAALDDAGVDPEEISGYERTVRAHESPARTVADGGADVGLGLRASAAKLGLGFVPLGEERVRVLVNPERREKAGVAALDAALDGLAGLVADLPGYETA